MKGKDLLSIADLSSEDISQLISDAVDMKTAGWLSMLSGKTLAIMFEKPSLRTRVSFELAMRQLGGQTIYLSPAEVGLGQREAVPDVARVLSRYVDAIAARTFSHESLEVLAGSATVPVINALSDWEHPCQALADILTIYEKKGELGGLTLAFVGDGNNVARSLMLAASLTGMRFRIASPAGYRVDDRVVQLAQTNAASSGGEILCLEDPRLAVSRADIVYTDVWASMGQEAEAEARRKIFAGYQVTTELLSLAGEEAIFMHPLPAHHGEEVAEGVIDSPRSVVFDQAENRLHLQKALLAQMLGGLEIPMSGYR
jgi:ornithine carbamoyltransferase